jgi:hypothetical protein
LGPLLPTDNQYCTNIIIGTQANNRLAPKDFVGTIQIMETRGRPKLDPEGAPSKYLTIRVAGGEYEAYQQAAERAESTLSSWIRDRLNRAARRGGSKRK